jgi:hypothetical protein
MRAIYSIDALLRQGALHADASIFPVGDEYELRVTLRWGRDSGVLTPDGYKDGAPFLFGGPRIALRMAEDVLRCLDRGDDPAAIAGWVWTPTVRPEPTPLGAEDAATLRALGYTPQTRTSGPLEAEEPEEPVCTAYEQEQWRLDRELLRAVQEDMRR